MKKKWARVLLSSVLAAALFTGCSSAPTSEEKTAGNSQAEADATEKVKVSLLVTGSFGDKAFNDSAQAGMKQIAEQLGDKVEVNMVEMGSDKTKFEGSLLDASESDSDIIIVGTWDMKEILEQTAPLFPEKKYIIFDTDVDYTIDDLSNVYSMSYKQNEAAFLAGVLAASTTTSDMTYANEEEIIGFIGAKDTAAVINDSAVGFIQGAQFINPEIKVMVSYVGSYVDSAKAKELALTQYASGADCVFVAAGPASVGVIEAAAESQKYVIGVDSDQALAYDGSEEAEFIISSAIKGVGTTIFTSIERDLASNLPYGTYELLGLAENAVGLADNEIYQTVVSEEIRNSVEAAKQSLLDGKVSVDTAYGMDEATLKDIISSAQ